LFEREIWVSSWSDCWTGNLDSWNCHGIPDRCEQTATYEVIAIIGTVITLSFVSNEKGFDGRLGKFTPFFAVGFTPIVPIFPFPPTGTASPDLVAVIQDGNVDSTGLFIGDVITSPTNPLLLGQTYLTFLADPTPIGDPKIARRSIRLIPTSLDLRARAAAVSRNGTVAPGSPLLNYTLVANQATLNRSEQSRR
jgi:hypothetical protein